VAIDGCKEMTERHMPTKTYVTGTNASQETTKCALYCSPKATFILNTLHIEA